MTRTHPYTGISIEFPGKKDGVFNPASEPFAEEIVEHWHREGGDFVSLKQPWGGQYIGGTRGYNPNIADAMPPHFKGCGITGRAIDASWCASDLGMRVAIYGGAAWLFASGTETERDVVYMTPDRLDDIAEAAEDLAERIGMDYYWLDDMRMLISRIGRKRGSAWLDPMEDARRMGEDPEVHRLREGYPGPVRWDEAAINIFEAWREGLHRVDSSITVGVEPDPRGQFKKDGSWDDAPLVDDWLPKDTPFMAVCDPPRIDYYPPNDTDRLAFLILNNVPADFTIADYLAWKRKANALGYSTIVTLWVWRVLMKRAGKAVPGGG